MMISFGNLRALKYRSIPDKQVEPSIETYFDTQSNQVLASAKLDDGVSQLFYRSGDWPGLAFQGQLRTGSSPEAGTFP